MEWLESLFPLLLFLIYFLAQIRKRRTKGQPAAAEGAPTEVQHPRKLTPFQEIIRQIQEAAEQAQANQQGAAEQVATNSAEFSEALLLPPQTEQNLNTSGFHDLGGFEHDQHGFGDANPFSEQAFEQQAPSPRPPPHKQGHIDYNPHASLVRVAAPRVEGRGRRLHPLVAGLRSAQGLKEAFILKEILERPLSRRKAD